MLCSRERRCVLSAQLEPNRKFDRNRTYDPLFTCPDTLPLSYTRLVEATATKLESSDKHSSYSYDWNINVTYYDDSGDDDDDDSGGSAGGGGGGGGCSGGGGGGSGGGDGGGGGGSDDDDDDDV